MGPVDRFRITLRIIGEDLDPDHITALLGSAPTRAEKKGNPIHTGAGRTRVPKRGHWSLSIDSSDCGDADIEDGVRMLLSRLPQDLDLWASLAGTYRVDVFCGLFFESDNRGFGVSAEVSRMLAERQLPIGFDVYFDPPRA